MLCYTNYWNTPLNLFCLSPYRFVFFIKYSIILLQQFKSTVYKVIHFVSGQYGQVRCCAMLPRFSTRRCFLTLICITGVLVVIINLLTHQEESNSLPASTKAKPRHIFESIILGPFETWTQVSDYNNYITINQWHCPFIRNQRKVKIFTIPIFME